MLLFVYGSLKKNFESHFLLEGSKLIGEAWIYGSMYELSDGFPVVCLDGSRNKSYGEIYELNEEQIGDVDLYEGYDPDNDERSIYSRKEIKAYLSEKKETLQAAVYFMDERKLSRFIPIPLKNGKWNK